MDVVTSALRARLPQFASLLESSRETTAALLATSWRERQLARGQTLSLAPAGLEDDDATILWHAMHEAACEGWGDEWEEVGNTCMFA